MTGRLEELIEGLRTRELVSESNRAADLLERVLSSRNSIARRAAGLTEAGRKATEACIREIDAALGLGDEGGA